MSAAIVILAGWLTDRLVVGSLQGVLLVAMAWLAGRRRLALPAAMQAAIWWVVMLRIILVFAPLPSVPIPILPAVAPAATSSAVPVESGAADAVTPPHAASRVPAGVAWPVVLTGLWLMGVAWHAGRLLIARRRTQSAVWRSLSSDQDADTVRELAMAIGLSPPPAVRTSPDVRAPQVVGLRHPVVLMPADASLTPHERLMAIGHEFMHVKRRDLAFGWVPAIAERLFFFHPLVRFAAREYVTAREAACDASLVRRLGIAPDDYGRLLVRFGISGQRLAWSAGGGSASATSLRRRLDMLQHQSGYSRRTAWLVAAVMVVALVPSYLVARTMSPAAARPTSGASADVQLSRLLPPSASAAASQDAPVAPLPASPAPEARERVQAQGTQTDQTPGSLRDELAAVEQLLKARAEAEAIGALPGLRDQIAEAERQRQAAEQLYRALLENSQQVAQVLRENQTQDLLREAEQRMALARRQQDATNRAQDELNTSFSAARAQVLRHRLEELSRRLAALADMQRQLQRESDQLKRELNAF